MCVRCITTLICQVLFQKVNPLHEQLSGISGQVARPNSIHHTNGMQVLSSLSSANGSEQTLLSVSCAGTVQKVPKIFCSKQSQDMILSNGGEHCMELQDDKGN